MDPCLLILDVDETLIYATEFALSARHDFVVGPYYVHCRPGLKSFLLSCNKYYRLAIWSSGSRDYIDQIIENIRPAEVEFDFVWSRERCVRRFNPETYSDYHVKDLKKVKRLGYSLDRILVVDDTPQKLERHYGNLIKIPEFTGDLSDECLHKLSVYLELIKDEVNFRQLDKRGWLFNRGK